MKEDPRCYAVAMPDEPELPSISCDNKTLISMITRRDKAPPDGIEIADGNGIVDLQATTAAQKSLDEYRRNFYAGVSINSLLEGLEDSGQVQVFGDDDTLTEAERKELDENET